jgi:hypothetical protein
MSIWQGLLQVMAAAMVVSIVCRAVRMTADTREAVRWAMVAQGVSSLALVVVPFGRPHWLPWLVAGYMASSLFMQWATSYYWRSGQPAQFTRGESA